MIAGFERHKERHTEKGTGFKWKPKDGDEKANAIRANAALCPTDNSIKEVKKNQIITSRIRRLTPIECERLQTVKDNYTNYVSDSQRYKMLGNGWTIDTIAHIFKYISLL